MYRDKRVDAVRAEGDFPIVEGNLCARCAADAAAPGSNLCEDCLGIEQHINNDPLFAVRWDIVALCLVAAGITLYVAAHKWGW